MIVIYFPYYRVEITIIIEKHGASYMIKEYELREELNEVADILHQYNANPSSWLSWITYFLARLDDKAMDVDPANQRRYEDMLSNLQDSIHNRRRTGGW
jgi:hypothetical protein